MPVRAGKEWVLQRARPAAGTRHGSKRFVMPGRALLPPVMRCPAVHCWTMRKATLPTRTGDHRRSQEITGDHRSKKTGRNPSTLECGRVHTCGSNITVVGSEQEALS